MKGVFVMRKSGMTARIAAAVLAAAMAVSDAVPSFAAGNLTAETTEQGAVNGVSKVIGLEGKYAANRMRSDDWEEEKEYVWLNGTDNQIVVGGAAESFVDSATGLYKNGADYYAYIEGSTGTVLTLQGKVAAGSFTALPQNENYGDSLPQRDAATGFYEKNGVKYRLFGGNSGRKTPTTPVFMLTKRFWIFGWEAEPSNPSRPGTPCPACSVCCGSRMPCG